ncbi:hypothetical protein Trydic_g7776 [Trypoxylus dichotomus]
MQPTLHHRRWNTPMITRSSEILEMTPLRRSKISGRHLDSDTDSRKRPGTKSPGACRATGSVKLVAAYEVPNRQLLKDDLSEIFDTWRLVIFAGDLNAKHPSWNSRVTKASGTRLRRFVDDYHLLVETSVESTIFPHNTQPDVPHIVVMRNVVQFHQLTQDRRPNHIQKAQEETDDFDIIPSCQFGFRREHSTIHQVSRIVKQIKEGFNVREYAGTVFLDVAKGLDKVWHQALLLKMHRAGTSKAMLRLIHSYLRWKAFKDKLEGQPIVRTATAGMPQGSVISTFPFSIYTSDIPTTAYVNLAMYADDVCIFTGSRRHQLLATSDQTLGGHIGF